ncbi:hypothetical protein CcNV_054 [Crangon crangon nudivirus]|uniref:Uncharacterized protein n=1 Tax=Crangon crangon nudivirus TaxID=2880838 RepID=A0AAE8Y239_9VIRU|nr:hypothetical protein QKT25_gp055 [Crangon crangon nudivirus]UBZ25539.1 hypothetical protein CcNV_054 [Crangon crangon nudivirus]
MVDYNNMLWLIIVWSFITMVLLIFARDSWLNREYAIYKLKSTKPYIIREFVKDTYSTFTI